MVAPRYHRRLLKRNNRHQHRPVVTNNTFKSWKSIRDQNRSLNKLNNNPLPSVPFKIGSVNINGLDGHGAWAIEQLMINNHYDIFAVSETHFRQDVPKDRFNMPGFSSFHSERLYIL